jgi:MFS family permease
MSQKDLQATWPRTRAASDRGAACGVRGPRAGARASQVENRELHGRPGPFGLARTFWMLWAGMLLNRLGGTVYFMLGIYLTRERGLRPETAGLVISLYAAGGLFAGPLGGMLADRVGRRKTLLLGTACAGTLMLALGFARSIEAIVVIAPALGFCTDACRPAVNAGIADVVPPAERARAYGLLYWAMNLGFSVAAAFGGVLAEHHFTLLFVIDGLTTLAYGAVVFVGVPETRPRSASGAAVDRSGFAFAGPLRDRAFVSFVLAQVPLLVAFAQVIVSLPLDMQAHGLDVKTIGWLLGLNGVCIVVFQPIALRALRGMRPLAWLVAGCVTTGLGLGANALAATAPMYVLTGVLWTLGEIGFSTGTPTLVANFAPADQRGVYQGTYQLAWGASSMLAPTVGTLMLARFGGGALWAASFASCIVAATVHSTVTARNQRWLTDGES